MQPTLHSWQVALQEMVLVVLIQLLLLAWGSFHYLSDHLEFSMLKLWSYIDDMHWIFEEYLGKIGTGLGLPAGGTLMFGWKKLAEAAVWVIDIVCWELLEEAAEGAFGIDCWDLLLFSCCKAFNLGEQVDVWVEFELTKQTAWVPVSMVATAVLLEGALFRSSPNRFTILSGLSNLQF